VSAAVKPISSDEDYQSALWRIESLMDAEEGTPELDELEMLASLVELYEDQHFPIDLPDPIEAIRFRMEMTSG
jgi:HTH-type transcriptional regulator / antitoxin HigA